MVFAKSGAHVERPPENDSFWYLRGASILRKIYVRGTLGTQRLRAEYGGKRNRGAKPGEHRKAGGSIIRKLLQQLEAVGYIKKVKVGRVITPAGQKFLDNTAYALYKKPKTQEEKIDVVKEKAKEMAEKLPGEKKEKPKLRAPERRGTGAPKSFSIPAHGPKTARDQKPKRAIL